MTTAAKERAHVDLDVKGVARNSRLRIEGAHLPVSDLEISCEAGDYTILKAEFAPKSEFETVIEGLFVSGDLPHAKRLRLVFGPTFADCVVELDGEDLPCHSVFVSVSPKDGRTRVTLVRPSVLARDGFGRCNPEITGILHDDLSENTKRSVIPKR